MCHDCNSSRNGEMTGKEVSLAARHSRLAARRASSCWPGSALLPALAINARVSYKQLKVAEAFERLPTPPSTRSRTVPTHLQHLGAAS